MKPQSITTKRCWICREHKPLEEFHLCSRSRDSHQGACKPCTKTQHKLWVRTHRKQAALIELRRQCKRYGITPEQYNKILVAQKSICKICGNSNESYKDGKHRLFIDHDHKTGKVRGLLCDACNRGLGYFKNEPKLLKNAIQYLELD